MSQKTDNVTGLIELGSVTDTIQSFCSVAKSGYVLHIGIDNFRTIVERFGHSYGDFILKGVADCISEAIGVGEEVYRAASDEFFVISYLSDDKQDGKKLYEEICRNVEAFIEANNYQAVFTISGGLLSCKEIEGMQFEELIMLSEFTLSQAKQQGKNQIAFFDEGAYEQFLKRNSLLSTITESVASSFEGFEVSFQPIIMSVDDEQPYAAEVRVKYTLPTGTEIPEEEFLPILEQSGLILPVGKWVLDKATAFYSQVCEKMPELKLSVNVLYVQELRNHFEVELFRLLKKHEMTSYHIVARLPEFADYGVMVLSADTDGVREEKIVAMAQGLGLEIYEGAYCGSSCTESEFINTFGN